MSLLADSAAIAVLVLAWDETTPAVRALVAATEAAEPTVDSVVVLVPAGPATDELTPEEFLPLPASLLPSELPVAAAAVMAPSSYPAPATEPPTPLLEAPLAVPSAAIAPPVEPATTLLAVPVVPVLPFPTGSAVASPPVSPAPGPAGLAALTTAALTGPAVRILRLSEYSLAALAAYTQQALPAPTWLGTAGTPAAPYLGSSAEAEVTVLTDRTSSIAPTTASALPLSSTDAEPASAKHAGALGRGSAAASPGYLAAEPPAASDTLAAPITEEPLPAAIGASAELDEEIKDELDAFPITVEITPAQAGWPDALASLQEPVTLPGAEAPVIATEQIASALPEPAALADEETNLPAHLAVLLPATSQFDAPNLNFQVIQYARFAVPLALAAQPFAVIYAPAWPTWLAAQELRQRTGLPLVLHVATLAAEDEPLDLAAGWPAEIQRQALHRADLILTETPALAYRLRRELELPAHRVRPVSAANADAVAQALSTVQAQ